MKSNTPSSPRRTWTQYFQSWNPFAATKISDVGTRPHHEPEIGNPEHLEFLAKSGSGFYHAIIDYCNPSADKDIIKLIDKIAHYTKLNTYQHGRLWAYLNTPANEDLSAPMLINTLLQVGKKDISTNPNEKLFGPNRHEFNLAVKLIADIYQKSHSSSTHPLKTAIEEQKKWSYKKTVKILDGVKRIDKAEELNSKLHQEFGLSEGEKKLLPTHMKDHLQFLISNIKVRTAIGTIGMLGLVGLTFAATAMKLGFLAFSLPVILPFTATALLSAAGYGYFTQTIVKERNSIAKKLSDNVGTIHLLRAVYKDHKTEIVQLFTGPETAPKLDPALQSQHTQTVEAAHNTAEQPAAAASQAAHSVEAPATILHQPTPSRAAAAPIILGTSATPAAATLNPSAGVFNRIPTPPRVASISPAASRTIPAERAASVVSDASSPNPDSEGSEILAPQAAEANRTGPTRSHAHRIEQQKQQEQQATGHAA